jgi:hypothetical protein
MPLVIGISPTRLYVRNPDWVRAERTYPREQLVDVTVEKFPKSPQVWRVVIALRSHLPVRLMEGRPEHDMLAVVEPLKKAMQATRPGGQPPAVAAADATVPA